MRLPRKKTLLVTALGLLVLAVSGLYGGFQYAKSRFFHETPNTLTARGEFRPIRFEWTDTKYENHTELKDGMLVRVTVPGLETPFHMQFDTGSPYSFIRSGAVEPLRSHGIEFDLFKDDEATRATRFAFKLGGSDVVLKSALILGRRTRIDWDSEDAINIIGSIGSDLLEDRVCVIDFPAQEIRLAKRRSPSLDAMGRFSAFSFRGRRIMLPAKINGVDQELFYDSGCSAFGLLTSKYHFDRYADAEAESIRYNANRHGDPLPVHHQPCRVTATLGDVEWPLQRVSYVDMYAGVQAALGGFVQGGVVGNRSLLDSTLVIDTTASEFLLIPKSMGK